MHPPSPHGRSQLHTAARAAGDKAEAREWLARAISDEVPSSRLDETAKEARTAAEKAMASL